VREVKRLTLREVEEATGRQVSNAYLSQLEKGKISKPSPNVLHSLALAYGIAYDTLMEKAGYFVDATGTEALRSAQGSSSKARKNALTDEDLTNEEELKLLEYLAFIRRK
jgi:HTH-type transcriptional regulator, competence development regulator